MKTDAFFISEKKEGDTLGIYSQIKEQVSTREVAEHYGYKVSRNGMMCCPFHNDRTPSMKVDQNFICFGCQEKGDVIDFTAKLFGLSPYDAAGKLIADMGLMVTSDDIPKVPPGTRQRAKRERLEKEKFEQTVSRIYNVYCDYFHLLNEWAEVHAPRSPTEELHPLFVEAMHQRDYVEYLLDLLLYGSKEDKASVVIERGKGVNDLERRIREFKSGDRERSSRSVVGSIAGHDGRGREGVSGNDRERPDQKLFSNAVTILSYDPLLRDSVRYNELTQRVDVVKNLGWERRDGKALVDNDLHNIHYYCERTYGITALKTIEEAVHMVANRNAYHPVRDFLNSLEWDGEERIRYALHRYLGADTSDYTYEILKFFMLGAVSRVFRPGVKFDYIICVVGDQGAGKSSFFRLLAVEDEWFTDDLKDLESNKVYEKLQGHWIIELSEMLATNNAKSNEAIKSFLSRQKEIYRTPYERYPKDRPRQCVFAGTTNKISFLPSDRTGNRRFLPIACQESEAEVFILDNEAESRAYIRQMWAEVMAIWKSGKVKLKLSPEMATEVRRRQKQFMQEDVDSGLILDFMLDFTGDKVCSKQLFREALHNEFAQPQRWQTNEINDIMNQLIREGTLTGWRYFDKPRRFTGTDYGSQKGWERVTDPSPDACKDVPTDDGFRQVRFGEDIPFPDPDTP